jgi:hypothetical protein
MEPSLGTYDALQRNDYLNVPRSLSLPLERHIPQRHVINSAAWFGKEQNIDAKSELREQIWHCLPRTRYSHTHSPSTRLASCFQPTHARAYSSAQSILSLQLARTCSSLNLHILVTQLALSLQLTGIFSSLPSSLLSSLLSSLSPDNTHNLISFS